MYILSSLQKEPNYALNKLFLKKNLNFEKQPFSSFIKCFCSQDSNSSSDMKQQFSKKKFHSEQVSPFREISN